MDKIVVSCLESRIDENQSVYSRFLLGPFLGGHAVTVATALRRALLSEVKNIAITALHIQGVTHEFSTVVGIRESVLELSLNFQQIILSTQTKTKNVQVGYLHVQGPAIVHANDLKLPDGIECVNPTQYIATLSSEGLLVVKFLIYDKKSFLKSKTSTLNSKKIKEALAFSGRLSKSLLGHAEYDPSQLFRLLRNQSLPSVGAGQGVLESLLPPPPYSRQGEPRRRPVLQALPLEDLQEEGNHLNAAPPQRFARGLATDSQSGGPGKPAAPAAPPLAQPTAVPERRGSGMAAVGRAGRRWDQQRTDLEVPRVGNLSRDLRTVGTDSNLDHRPPARSASLLSDEFNSEVCLRTIIPLEPIFTPVYQVNFGIERDDLSNQIRERIIMEVWTNGSIHPRQAINEAVLSTMSIFSKLRKTFQLDSHALPLSANSAAAFTNRTPPRRSRGARAQPTAVQAPLPRRVSGTAPAAGGGPGNGLVSSGFARARRLHQSKSTVKDSPLNDDMSESDRLLARSRPYSPVPPTDPPLRLHSGPRRRGAVHGGVRYSPRRGQPLVPSGSLDFVDKKQELCLATNGGKSDSGLTGDRLTRQFKGRPNFTKLDLTNSDIPKLNSFSSLEFVRSRHPVALFLQSFGKSHIRGQTFLLEQSFGLKARFFKGHRAVLSKAKYTSEALTFKRTFLPSFKVVLGRPPALSAVQAAAQPTAVQWRVRLTKVQLLFRLRFCLSGAILRGTPSGSLCSTNDPPAAGAVAPIPPRRGAGAAIPPTRRLPTAPTAGLRLCPSGAVGSAPAENKPAAGSAPVCSGRFALALFGQVQPVPAGGAVRRPEQTGAEPAAGLFSAGSAEEEPRNFLSPGCEFVANQGRARMRTAATLRFAANLQFGTDGQQQIKEWQGQQPKRKPILFLIKYRTFSFTRNALHIFDRQQESSLFLLPLTKQLIRLKMVLVLNSCLPLISERSEPSLRFQATETQAFTTVEGSALFDGKQVLLSRARSALNCSSIPCTQSNVGDSNNSATEPPRRPAALPAVSARCRTGRSGGRRGGSEQFGKFMRGATRVLPLAPSKSEQALPSAVGKLWLRKNLKKQFGFFQFACHGLRVGRMLATDSPWGEKTRRGSTISHTFFTDRAFLLTRLQRLTKSETRLAKLGPSALCSAYLSQNAIANSAVERLEAPANLRFASSTAPAAGPEHELALAPRKRSLPLTAGRRRGSRLLETRASRGPVQDSLTSCSPQLSQTEQKQDIFEFAKSTNRAGGRLRSPLLCGVVFGAAVHWKKRWMVRLGVCVNRTGPLTNRSRARGRFVNSGDDTALSTAPAAGRTGNAMALSKKSNFTTFPLIMTKVPPLCLPSGMVTLISFPSAESRPGKIDGLTSARYSSTKQGKSKVRPGGRRGVSKPCMGFARRPPGRSLQFRKTEQNRVGGRQEQGAAYKTPLRSSGAALRGGVVSKRAATDDLFGFNSGGTVVAGRAGGRFVQAAESSFQLTTQERLSILYASNLDKISFLSSDLANLPLSLKTYTFLKKKGKKNMASLLKCSPNALFSLLNGDEKMFHEIERCFLFLGLPFKERF